MIFGSRAALVQRSRDIRGVPPPRLMTTVAELGASTPPPSRTTMRTMNRTRFDRPDTGMNTGAVPADRGAAPGACPYRRHQTIAQPARIVLTQKLLQGPSVFGNARIPAGGRGAVSCVP
jgi:hypothetical protein